MFIHYRAFTTQNDGTPPPPNASKPLGIASVVVGMLTMMVAWVPYLGMLAVPVAGVGVALALVGIIVGRLAGQRRIPVPAVGLIVCGLSIGLSFLSTAAWQNRPGAPGRASSAPAPPAIDMTHTAGRPFVPKPPPAVTRPVFVVPKFEHPMRPDAPPDVERGDAPAQNRMDPKKPM